MNDAIDPQTGKARGPLQLTATQRANLAARLSLTPDRTDRGEPLPKMTAALNMPQGNVAESAQRTAALARAIVQERFVVPVPVEEDPHHPDHEHQGLGDADHVPLATTDVDGEPVIVAFSSVEALHFWEPSARPMIMSGQKVALTAGLATPGGRVVVNPGSTSSTLLPIPVVQALAGEEAWLAPWEDKDLAKHLTDLGRKVCPLVVSVSLKPTGSGSPARALSGSASKWGGEVTATVYVEMRGQDAEVRACVAHALQAIASFPRLGASSERVNLVPKPVSLA